MTIEEVKELKDYMRVGIIDFSYRKKNGELREAKGTLDMKYIEDHGALPNGNGTETPGVLKYWDVNSGGWRSCIEELIIGFNKPDASQMKMNI